MITISTSWLIALGVTAYLIYKFWKKVLKTILVLSILSLVYVVVKVKNTVDEFLDNDTKTTEIIDSKELEKTIAKTWERTTTEYQNLAK
jgi:hypothetical protein